jgi:hypothetical protein
MSPEINNPGENKAWEILASLHPGAVCRSATASFDAVRKEYAINSFGIDFSVSAEKKTINGTGSKSVILTGKFGYFFRVAVLWYLVSAKDITCTGRLVRLEHLRGGELFSRGSHLLPLDAVAKKYARDKEGFLKKGRELGGEESASLGDAAIRLLPLPRVPVMLSLWLEDEEFPPRADLLFDSTCDLQLPPDVAWSVAMLTVLLMLE